jgi:hypothetical protein
MRQAVACLAALGLAAACSKAPSADAAANQASAAPAPAASGAPVSGAPVSGAPVSGVYTAGGKPAVLTDISTQKDDPFDGVPVTLVVMTAQSQGGEAAASDDAHNGKFGDALIIRVEPDGTVIGSDFVHHGLVKSDGYMSQTGTLTLKDYKAAGGQISGHITSGGPAGVGATADNQFINVDLTFHVKAPTP